MTDLEAGFWCLVSVGCFIMFIVALLDTKGPNWS